MVNVSENIAYPTDTTNIRAITPIITMFFFFIFFILTPFKILKYNLFIICLPNKN